MRFRDIELNNQKPPRVVVLSPSAFASTFSKRPSSDVSVGIRLISEKERGNLEEAARAELAGFLGEDALALPTTGELLDEVLVHTVVRLGTCDPNDATRPHPLFGASSEALKTALTPATIGHLWDQIDGLAIMSNPAIPLPTPEDVETFRARLMDGSFFKIEGKRGARVRRLLSFLRDEIEGANRPSARNEVH